ncbi:thiamine pyrophosphate-binding protein [Candidatus Pelagibacter sp.]|nr:thiamine pyrophosphate-binding protein [Candidatus Pelagibacter sp.]
MAKMTTEEAFVKVLQMHGIEHSFGIIGSAFMPISDLFPEAGITFWDVAHETNGGLIADGYTRATGKNVNGDCSKWSRYNRTCYTN